jgi:hypothetical protein
MKLDFIRVPYGKDNVEDELKEYKIVGQGLNSPVGTKQEISDFVKERGIEVGEFIEKEDPRWKKYWKIK